MWLGVTVEDIKSRLSTVKTKQKIVISKDEMVFLFSEFGSWSAVSRYLGISLRTVQRISKFYDLHVICGLSKLM